MDKTVRACIEVRYEVICRGDEPLEITLSTRFDPDTFERIRDKCEPPPAWTRLEAHRCAHCALQSEHCTHCPAAVAVADLIGPFEEVKSYTEATVCIHTDERIVTSETTVQRALRSLMGLYMATSGCPTLDKLKPMARYHLPFATPGETMFRTASAYLLAQYFLEQRNGAGEFGFEGLRKLYDEIHGINESLANRIRNLSREDAHVNALVMLDLYTHLVPFSLDEDLAELEPLFSAYFANGADGSV
ncbi:MAG: hypothetical protein GWP08_17550 [Nitrospiraceae bacterium]|nr:hypothetical protein [Nitrospiraceae bacterium]